MKAEEILNDNISDSVSNHLDKMPHCRGWIIEAMTEYSTIVAHQYANQRVIEELERVMENLDSPSSRDKVSKRIKELKQER